MEAIDIIDVWVRWVDWALLRYTEELHYSRSASNLVIICIKKYIEVSEEVRNPTESAPTNTKLEKYM